MNAPYISVSELQNIYAPLLDYSGLSTTTISGLINVASRRVDSFTNASRGWEYETITDEVYDSYTQCHTDSDSNIFVNLVKRPLNLATDVTSIKFTIGSSQTSLTLLNNGTSVLQVPYPGNYFIYPNTFLASTGTLLGQARLRNSRSFRYSLLLTYSAGYQTIPEDIKMATALYVQDLIAQGQNPTGAVSFSQGSMSYSYDRGGKSPLVLQAQSILQNYKKVV